MVCRQDVLDVVFVWKVYQIESRKFKQNKVCVDMYMFRSAVINFWIEFQFEQSIEDVFKLDEVTCSVAWQILTRWETNLCPDSPLSWYLIFVWSKLIIPDVK